MKSYLLKQRGIKMGVLLTGSSYKNVKEYFHAELLNGFAEGVIVEDFSLKADRAFLLLSYTDKKTYEVKKSIYIYKIVKWEGRFGYKSFDEESMPYTYGCPERILKKSTNMNEKAIEWRELNRKSLKNKKELKNNILSMKAGNVYKTNNHEVVFLYHYTASRFAGYKLDDPKKEIFSFKYEFVKFEESSVVV